MQFYIENQLFPDILHYQLYILFRNFIVGVILLRIEHYPDKSLRTVYGRH